MGITFNENWLDTSNAINSGAFDPVGANYFSPDLGSTIPQTLPGFGSSFAPSQTSNGNTVASSGSASGGGGSAGLDLGTFAPAYAAGSPVNNSPTQVTVNKSPSGIVSNSVGDYFLRGIIVILGFIFVAIGLHQLAPSVVPDVRNVVRTPKGRIAK